MKFVLTNCYKVFSVFACFHPCCEPEEKKNLCFTLILLNQTYIAETMRENSIMESILKHLYSEICPPTPAKNGSGEYEITRVTYSQSAYKTPI